MKVLFRVDFQNNTYVREKEVPFVPCHGNISLLVSSGYYSFKIKNVSMDEFPNNDWQVIINLESLPITHQLQNPLDFESDPRWEK